MTFHLQTVDDLENELFVLKCRLIRVQPLVRYHVRIGAFETILKPFYHEKANVEEVGRLADNFFANLKLQALLLRCLQLFMKIFKLLLQLLHLVGLQEEGANLLLKRLGQNFELAHCHVRIVEFSLFFRLLFVLECELVDEDTDEIRVDHCIDHVDAEHHYNLICRACVDFNESK